MARRLWRPRPWHRRFIANPSGGANSSFSSILADLGLDTSAVLVLDAGDAASYDGTAQQWTDLSGQSNHYYRGTTSGSDATDPTFNGVAGLKSSAEFFSVDGSDYFAPVTTTTFDDGWHKNNALFGIAGWFYWASATSCAIMQNMNNSATHVGSSFRIDSGSVLSWLTYKGSGADFSASTTATVPTATPVFLALRVDEAADTLSFMINSTVETASCTYAAPSASNATGNVSLGASSTGAIPWPSTSRFYEVSSWSGRAPTTSELTSLYTATRGRFGV